MKRLLVVIFIVSLLTGLLAPLHQCVAQASGENIFGETEQERAARMKWWTEARFGMFIHWGLYALPARHEWVKNRERIPDEEYQKYFEMFNPDLYDPVEWARAAKKAGMKCIALKQPYASYAKIKSADLIVQKLSQITISTIKQL